MSKLSFSLLIFFTIILFVAGGKVTPTADNRCWSLGCKSEPVTQSFSCNGSKTEVRPDGTCTRCACRCQGPAFRKEVQGWYCCPGLCPATTKAPTPSKIISATTQSSRSTNGTVKGTTAKVTTTSQLNSTASKAVLPPNTTTNKPTVPGK